MSKWVPLLLWSVARLDPVMLLLLLLLLLLLCRGECEIYDGKGCSELPLSRACYIVCY
ncbi:hypothetical protein K505DRAFT_320397 [Melanomma pulvis-pyrius CBS 109.77]|uniref:Uncharacterized protein n=1 Tax=Melanomma pulvis-pyrius CBS 109.77 TaxID=1314802 RepID=A0A6A6XVT8_9PLEO|nr:hypothetical protein K505DRAFT_320397 [Melanomma pulvis-pyrius CBS 109.77]